MNDGNSGNSNDERGHASSVPTINGGTWNQIGQDIDGEASLVMVVAMVRIIK